VRLRLLAQPCFLKVFSDRRCKGALTVAIGSDAGHNFYAGCGCIQLECLPLTLSLGINSILADAEPDAFAALPPVQVVSALGVPFLFSVDPHDILLNSTVR